MQSMLGEWDGGKIISAFDYSMRIETLVNSIIFSSVDLTSGE